MAPRPGHSGHALLATVVAMLQLQGFGEEQWQAGESFNEQQQLHVLEQLQQRHQQSKHEQIHDNLQQQDLTQDNLQQQQQPQHQSRLLQQYPGNSPGAQSSAQQGQSGEEPAAVEAQDKAAAAAAKAAGAQSKAQAQVQAMDPGDPRNVPSGAWPASTAEESQRAWPAGQQPQPMAAWPVQQGGLSMCWQTTVLQDIHEGWPGQCVGLALVQPPTQLQCQNSCLNDPRCSVWQFNPRQIQGGCWQGKGLNCDTRNGFATVSFSGGQRIQHGSVRVLKELGGIEVHNLRNLGVVSGKDQNSNIERCRHFCYSDILCQYWQYGSNGCSVEDPTYAFVQYPLTLQGGASKTSEYASTVIAGEFIQHYCPPRSQQQHPAVVSKGEPDPLGEYANWRVVPYIILGALIILALSCLAFCVLDFQKETAALEPKKLRTKDAASSPGLRVDGQADLYDWRSNFKAEPMLPPQAPLPAQLAALPQRIFSSQQQQQQMPTQHQMQPMPTQQQLPMQPGGLRPTQAALPTQPFGGSPHAGASPQAMPTMHGLHPGYSGRR